MAFIDQLKGIFIKPNLDSQQLRAETPKPPVEKKTKAVSDTKDPLRRKVKSRNYRLQFLLKVWRQAVDAAEYDLRPDRRTLYQLYHQSMEDEHLLGQLGNAIANIQMSPYFIERDGVEDEEAIKLFDKPWFGDLLKYAVETELFGHSLLEFTFKGGEVNETLLIPRVHVRPEFMYGDVLLTVSDTVGISFRSGPLTKTTLEMGSPADLGKMKVLTKLVIRKDHAVTDWSRRNERFGMPFITVKTASRDPEELNAKEEMLRNFGSNSYAILDDADEISMLEPVSNTGGGHVTFKSMWEKFDSAISILVNGQTGTTDEKSFVGSANVHERQQNKLTLARQKWSQDWINENLMDFLISKGYPLQNCKLKFRDLEMKDQEATDEDLPTKQSDEVKDDEQQTAKKKS